MSETFELRQNGRDRAVTLEDRALVIGGHTTGLDAIRQVGIARIGTLHICTLHMDGDREQTFATDEASHRANFAAAVRALYAALASRRVPFVAGSKVAAAIILTASAVCGLVGALFFLGVIDAPAFALRGGMLALVCGIAGPIGAVRSLPKKLSSEAELDAVLPKA